MAQYRWINAGPPSSRHSSSTCQIELAGYLVQAARGRNTGAALPCSLPCCKVHGVHCTIFTRATVLLHRKLTFPMLIFEEADCCGNAVRCCAAAIVRNA